MNETVQLEGVPIFEEDPFTKSVIDDPNPTYARMRDAGPVVWLRSHDCYAVARHEEVQTVTRDWENFSSASGTGLANYSKQKPWRPPAIVLEADPPMHTKGRRIFARVLSPGAIRALREAFERQAEDLVNRVLDLREIDGITDLAQPYTLKIFPDAVGLPSEGRHKLLEYGDMQLHSFVPPTWLDDDPYARLEEVGTWVMNNCRREALTPDGFGAAIYESMDTGEITEAEAQNLVRSFLSAGVDNSITSFGNSFWAFATFPDQWERLRAEPTLIRNAYEEVLRFMGPLLVNFRTTSRELEFGGARLGANQKVGVFLAAANRDPRHWSNPDALDIGRRVTGQHMAFGVGIHGCVGQVLARLEGEALFGALLRKVKSFELNGTPRRRYINVVQGFVSLPLRLVPL